MIADGPHCAIGYLQDRDMEPKYPRIANCSWCMVGWSYITYTQYVSYSELLVWPHVSFVPFPRPDNGDKLCQFSHLG